MSLQEFWDLLEKHDWHYSYSDDAGVYHTGAKLQSRLREIAKLSNEHAQLFMNFESFMYRTNLRVSKPRRPEEPKHIFPDMGPL
jgi:hypothetical protein